MFIHRLALKNFRAYRGRFVLEFPSSDGRRRVYLLGGENGAGKTSLLLALNLGLYGPAATGAWTQGRRRSAEETYRLALEDAFNSAASEAGEESMYVAVAFDAHGARFELHREWWFENGRLVDEDVRLRVDGAPLDDVEHDLSSLPGRQAAAQQLMEALLPARAARFFFFDGEDVASLAERDLGESVVHGLDELLGLDQVHRLAKELASVERAERNNLKQSPSSTTLESALDALRDAEDHHASAMADLQNLRTRLSETEAELRNTQTEIEALFAGRAVGSAGDLRLRREVILEDLTECNRRIATLTAETLGAVSSFATLQAVADGAERSIATRVEAEIESKVRERLASAAQRLGRARLDPPLTPTQRARLREIVAQEWAQDEAPSSEDDPLESFTLLDLQRLRARATSGSFAEGLHQLRTESARRRSLRRQMRHVEADLRQFEQSNTAADLLERRQQLETERTSLTTSVADADVAAERAEAELKAANAAVVEAEDSLAKTRVGAARAVIARRARTALERFGREMREQRSDQLEDLVAESLRELLHRSGAIATVAIDPVRSTVTLRDGAGREIPVPSAGEKELFALSLIRGLGQLSNRDAPMVIDTPLGRLDQAHRAAIVGRFLPTVATQVIVLATDSEINGDLYSLLRPNLAWQGTIVPTQTGVRIDEGRYFDEAKLP